MFGVCKELLVVGSGYFAGTAGHFEQGNMIDSCLKAYTLELAVPRQNWFELRAMNAVLYLGLEWDMLGYAVEDESPAQTAQEMRVR